MNQFLKIVNSFLYKDVHSHKRQLNLFVPPLIALSPAVRLIQADTDFSSLFRVHQVRAFFPIE